MALINSKEALKAYIKRQLGFGVNSIEVTDLQLEDAIENAVGYFEREVDGGVEDRIMILKLTAGVQQYVLEEAVMAISETFSIDFGNTNDILSSVSQFRIDYAQPLATAGSNLNVSSYIASMQYLNIINQYLKEGLTWSYNPVTKNLFIHETIKNNGLLAMTILYSTRDTPNMWNNDFVKEYSTALTMRQWGINLTKFRGAVLLGGLELNGDGMLQLAESEAQRIREDLKDRYTSPLGIWVG